MKIELSLSPEYVLHWTYLDALRELFQNAIDNGIDKMEFNYDQYKQELMIVSKNTEIKKETLLLGKSEKSENSIGKFGEGYKLALLVLTRLKKPVEIRTGSEIWKPAFGINHNLNSRTLRIYITKTFHWPDTVIIIKGLTKQEFDDYKRLNLHLQDYPEHAKAKNSNLLLGSKYKGSVFVGGLFITRLDGFGYGYDFKAGRIELGRDRNIVCQFELQWSGVDLIESYAMERPDQIIVAAEKVKDFEYLYNISEQAKNKIADELLRKHGKNSVFYEYQPEKKYKGNHVRLAGQLVKTITGCSRYRKHLEAIEQEPELTIRERLENWIEKYKMDMSIEAYQEFYEKILREV